MTKLEFSGNLEEIKSEIEQAIATYELLGNRSSVNFEQWFEKWEKGFPEATESRAAGNYQLAGEKPWREIGKLPRWRQWSNESGIITGEYWRDRSAEKDSILLSGTAEQLIQHIIQIEYEGDSTKEIGSEKSRAWPPMKGQPQIKLFFRGEDGKGVVSFRVMTLTDDPKIPLPKIDKSDLRKFALNIKNNFANPLFAWEKGRKVISYKNRWQGFDGQWFLCRNEVAGRQLLTKLLAIQGFQLDPAGIRMSEAIDEDLAFPAAPPDEIVLGESVSQNIQRPLVSASFWRAEIKLSKMRSPIALVERGTVVYE